MTRAADLTLALDILCPMHMLILPCGRIAHAGPTLRKLRPDQDLTGTDVFDLVEVLRPRGITDVAAILARAGRKLHLRFRHPACTALNGVAAPAPLGEGVILNLSFGISLPESLADYDLTGADFAPTDLTVEMLYLAEAKSAAMAASRHLNQRLEEARRAAEGQAQTDMLTGLKNRRALDRAIHRMIAEGRDFALMHVDLDYFKAVNDTAGHAAGDHVLRHFAAIMSEETRESDIVARVGGDEFVVLLPFVQERDILDRIATRLITRLNAPILFQGQICRTSCSIGIVLSGAYDTPQADRMLQDADRALYASKKAGRAAYTYFSDLMPDGSTPGITPCAPGSQAAPPSSR
ncbi:MAG: GGDEF domain-containing protein [Rhodobacteraceae bacterium]|nr:MAG: GGDEF domain-containing protein [Paracoccaceae bacterium]